MTAAAEAMDFEIAAVLRDRLRALTFIQGSQAINAEGSASDADIVALAVHGGVTCIQVFFIRGGQNWGHRAFFPAHTADVPEAEVLSSFLVQFYEDVPPPRRILLDRALPEAPLIAEALSEQAERKVEIDQPQRGPRRKLIDQARRNAEEALERRLAEGTTQGKLLRELADVFELFTQVDATRDRAGGGLGIGLSLVRKMVELHGGTVRCDSRGLGLGATFEIRLPLLVAV
jgi:excinuclease ABC subunit C